MSDLTAFSEALAREHLAVKHMDAWLNESDVRAMVEAEIFLLAEQFDIEVTEVNWWKTISDVSVTYNVGVRLAPRMVSVEITIRDTL